MRLFRVVLAVAGVASLAAAAQTADGGAVFEASRASCHASTNVLLAFCVE
jgi:cytochrome c5